MSYRYSFSSTDEIKPAGWLRTQLEIEAKGLCGNLDKVWPDVRNSKWIGGDREGWERVPYWLDGFIPLACLLDDVDMKSRAKKYIDRILDNMQPDGWICPNGDTPRDRYDTWAVFLIGKVLVNYENATHDGRIFPALYKIFKNYYELLKSGKIKLFDWGKFRWFEAFISLNALKTRYNDEWITSLAALIKEQGADYTSFTPLYVKHLNTWKYETHIVNIAMMLKYEVVSNEILGGKYTDSADKLFRFLTKYNGMAAGILAGDEVLAGKSPIQGAELCSVVELMYSFEHLFAFSGDIKWAKRLEKVAFNALPATLSDDMWTHQYDQLTNQIDCSPLGGRPIFTTNNDEAHVFGLEPNYGCCTANFGQGWPKLARSAFYKNENEIRMPVLLPASYISDGVRIDVRTDYPFENSAEIIVSCEKDTKKNFILDIPSCAENPTVNGEKTDKKQIKIKLEKGRKTALLSFETSPRFVNSPSGMKTVEFGPLLFSLPVGYAVEKREYVKNGVERKYPYCDYFLHGNGGFNYAFVSEKLEVSRNGVDRSCPFSSKHPPVTVKTEMCRIDWGYEEGYDKLPRKKPLHTKPLDAPVEKALIPYGCAKLRMTEMPKIK